MEKSFSVKNFLLIFEKENRKGNDLISQFFSEELKKLNKNLKRVKKYPKRIRKSFHLQRISRNTYSERLKKVDKIKKEYKKLQLELLANELKIIVRNIYSKKVKFELNPSIKCHSKQTYSIKKNAETFFLSKQLQETLSKIYSVKQADKNQIISQLSSILNDHYPKLILRTDIKSFFESINNQRLKELLNANPKLSHLSREYIDKILCSYQTLSLQSQGIPRGIGISSYLAELYMKDFDYRVNQYPNVIYYARYVDDIILILSRSEKLKVAIKEKINTELKNLDLILNECKTKLLDGTGSFEYLGYKFDLNNLDISPKRDKINLYKKKILISIEEYNNNQHKNPDFHKKLLIDRIRFLTGNVQLSNNKRHVFIGTYYSHAHSTNYNFTSGLDKFLQSKLDRMIKNKYLIKRLKKYSFEDGYKTKIIRKYNINYLLKLIKVWKDA